MDGNLRRAAELLLTESRELVPILRSVDPAALDAPTCLPDWSVRDVLAHCAAALGDVGRGITRDFGPAANEVDVVARRPLPVESVLTELVAAYAAGARAIDEAEGTLDGVGLGEWIHGGDIREALGVEGAYCSAGLPDALVLIAERSVRLGTPTITCTLDDAGPLTLGPAQDKPVGSFSGPAADLVRLVAGRPLPGRGRQLAGVEPADLRLFS